MRKLLSFLLAVVASSIVSRGQGVIELNFGTNTLNDFDPGQGLNYSFTVGQIGTSAYAQLNEGVDPVTGLTQWNLFDATTGGQVEALALGATNVTISLDWALADSTINLQDFQGNGYQLLPSQFSVPETMTFDSGGDYTGLSKDTSWPVVATPEPTTNSFFLVSLLVGLLHRTRATSFSFCKRIGHQLSRFSSVAFRWSRWFCTLGVVSLTRMLSRGARGAATVGASSNELLQNLLQDENHHSFGHKNFPSE